MKTPSSTNSCSQEEDSFSEDGDFTPAKAQTEHTPKSGHKSAEYKFYMARRSQIFRLNMTEEQKERYNEKAKLRMRDYRARMKEKEKDKVLTRKEAELKKAKDEEQRRKWREATRRSRERKRQLRLNQSDGVDNEETRSTANLKQKILRKLPNDKDDWCQIIDSILTQATPSKRQKLKEMGYIISPTTLQKSKACMESIDKMAAEDQSLRKKRSNDALVRRRILAEFLMPNPTTTNSTSSETEDELNGVDLLDYIDTGDVNTESLELLSPDDLNSELFTETLGAEVSITYTTADGTDIGTRTNTPDSEEGRDTQAEGPTEPQSSDVNATTVNCMEQSEADIGTVTHTVTPDSAPDSDEGRDTQTKDPTEPQGSDVNVTPVNCMEQSETDTLTETRTDTPDSEEGRDTQTKDPTETQGSDLTAWSSLRLILQLKHVQILQTRMRVETLRPKTPQNPRV
jgi:hypothetical protein